MKGRTMLFQVKRVLAMFLAVAMVVTMLPTTSYASTDGKDTAVNKDVTAYGTGDGGDEVKLKTSIAIELEEEDTTKEYTGEAVFKTFYQLKSCVKVTVNNEEIIPNTNDIVFTWKAVGKDGKLSDLPDDANAPVNAGKYNLTVELKAREGLYDAAKVEGGVEFVIEPSTVKVTPKMPETVMTGTKVSDIAVTEATAFAGNGKEFTFLTDDEETTDINEAEKSHLSISVSIKDAITGETLGADTVLAKNGDYVYAFETAFTKLGEEVAAGNYVIKDIAPIDVKVSDEIPTIVQITLGDSWNEAGKITHTYSGKEIATPVVGTDYTAKVVYDSGEVDEEGNIIYTEIADAQTTAAWYSLQKVTKYEDAQGNSEEAWEWVEIASAPTEAGTYLYRVSYAGVEGIYTESYSDITVVIEPMEVVIKPEANASAKFYHQMTEADVLAQIDYKVFDTTNTEVKVDRTTAWGVSYYNNEVTQSYEPVFTLQKETRDVSGNTIKDAEGNIVYADNNGELLDSSYKYRLLFSGYKTVYDEEGNDYWLVPINDTVNSVEMNYKVATDFVTALEKNAIEINVLEGTATTIDLSEILKALGNKGDSLDNVYTEIYDGSGLYDTRADYKKAVVKSGDKTIASGTDDTLTYIWYRNYNDSITDYKYSDATNELYRDYEINDFDESWHGIVYIPYEPGVYKLEVSYDDKDNDELNNAVANVYYVIEKQPIKVAFTEEFSTYEGFTVSEFFNYPGQYPWDKVSLNMITENGEEPLDWEYGEDYQISFDVEETRLVKKTDDQGNLVTDDAGNPVMVPVTRVVYHDCTVSGNEYQVVDAEGNPIEEEAVETMDYYDTFVENATYKIVPSVTILSNEWPTYRRDYYTGEKYVTEDITFLADPATKKTMTHGVRSTESFSDKADVKVKKLGESRLEITVDEDKLGTLEKVYDGTAFDLNAVLGDAVKVEAYTAEGKKEVTDVALNYTWYGTQWMEDPEEKYSGWFGTGHWSQAVDAGVYTLYVNYAGDDTYATLDYVEIARVEITPAKLTVTPVVADGVVAGTYVSTLCNSAEVQSSLVITGYAERDKEAFSYEPDEYYGAWQDVEYYENADGDYYDPKEVVPFRVYDEEGTPYYNVLTDEKTYTIKVSGGLSEFYANNYEVEFLEDTFTTVRGNSTVYDSSNDLYYQYFTNELEVTYDSVKTVKEVNGLTHTIKPIEAVPYSYETMTGEKNYGNFVELRIVAPNEYSSRIPSSAMYENSITEAGGYVEATSSSIYVIFDASAKDKKEFDIRWEDGYVEHFVLDFTSAELMGDLTEAVAPKSIKFNGAKTKMVVGEEQALDIKLTKVQKNDVICIGYDVDNKDVLSVDEQGNAIALKVGSATVTAYPVKLVDGQKVAISGAKSAKVKITVKDVTAPKIKKLNAKDDYIELQYSATPELEGYRREIYVLEGKNVKPAEFEQKIASMKNGQWEDLFVIAPVFYNYEDEMDDDDYWYLDADGVEPLYVNDKYDYTTIVTEIDELNPTTQYTVYVRNVSAVRELKDGSKVTLSASGSTKSFVTTKVQLNGLLSYPEGADYVPYNETTGEGGYYTINLVGGKATMTSEGYYGEKASNPAADRTDGLWLKLPLDKSLQSTYLNPKLTYKVYDEITPEGYQGKSKLATVNKKGKITLKGVGTVWIQVTDTNTGIVAWQVLVITAKANKVKGNKVKLGVGESVPLEEMLTYYEGAKKLTGENVGKVIIDEALISTFANNEYFDLNAETGMVTAVKAGGKLQVSLTDGNVQKNGGAATATATLTSQALDPVKNLKILNTKNLGWYEASLAHNYATLQFTYDDESGADSFLVEVKDGRGRVIRSVSYDRETLDTAWGADEKEYYCFTIGGLTQQSKYSVTVTALYNGIEAKEAKTTVKTTKIPASTRRIWGDASNHLNDGLKVVVTSEYGEDDINSDKFFISGNTYSLYAYPDYSEAEATGSDSLVWSSSNKKVATIKANPGGYFATFKALKVGTTVIEAKSKVTKEVVARYEVNVASVGDAYAIGRRFYEDNKPDYYDEPDTDVDDTDLSDGYAFVTMGAYSEEWITFSAPEDGFYSFYVSNGRGELYTTLGDEPAFGPGYYLGWVALEGRQEITIKLTNNNPYKDYVSVSTYNYKPFVTATLENGAVVEDNSYTYVRFVAPEDGSYKFTTDTDIEGASYWQLYEDINQGRKTYVSVSDQRPELLYDLKKGQTVYLYGYSDCDNIYDNFKLIVEKFVPSKLEGDSEKTVQIKDGEKQWFEFTAPETNYYTFTVKLPENVTDVYNQITIYDKIGGEQLNYAAGYMADISCAVEIKAGEKVSICLSSPYDNYEFNGIVKITKLPKLSVGTNVTVEGTAGVTTSAWMVFEAPEDAIYSFAMADTTVLSTNSIEVYDSVYGNMLTSDYNNYGGSSTALYEMKKGNVVYLNASAFWTGEEKSYAVKASKFSAKELKVDTDTAVKKAVGEEEWFAFTAPATNTYFFETTKAENATNATAQVTIYDAIGGNVLNSGASYSSALELVCDVKSNQTVYVCVTGIDELDTVDLTLRVTGISELVLDKEKAIAGQANTSMTTWMKFTAPKNGTYVFEPTTGTVLSSSSITIHNKVGGSTLATNSNSYGRCKTIYTMDAGTTVFVKATAMWSGEETSYALKVSQFAPIKLEKDKEVTVTKGAGEFEWYSFTAPETDTFTFIATEKEGAENASVSVKLYNKVGAYYSLNDASGDAEAEVAYDMEAGDKVYVRVSGYLSEDGVDAALKVVGVPEITLNKEMVIDGEGEKYAQAWIKFTAPKAGIYAFSTTERDELTYNYSSISVYNRIGDTLLASGYCYYDKCKAVCEMAAGETVYVYSYANWTGDAKSYAVKVTNYTMVELSEAKDTAVKLGAGEYDWFSFTAPESATYVFKGTETEGAENASTRIYLHTSVDQFSSLVAYSDGVGDEVQVAYEMKAGKTIYLRVSGRNNQDTVDATLSIERVPEIILDKEMVITGNANETITSWMKFTAPASGYYAFEPTDGTKLDSSSIYLYSEVTNSWALDSNTNNYGKCKTIYKMTVGEAVYVRATAKWSGEEKSYAVKVSKYEAAELTKDTEVAVNKNAGEYEWYSFTAPSTGAYTFTGTTTKDAENASMYINLYDKINGSWFKYGYGTTNPAMVTYDLNAGETIYVKVSGYYSDDIVDGTIKVSSATVLSVGTDVSVNGEANKAVNTEMVFTAPSDGLYAFEITGEVAISSSSMTLSYLETNNWLGDDSNSYGKSKIVCNLSAGTKALLKVSARWTGEETSYAVRVNEYTPTVLTKDTAANIAIGTGEYEWYSFTAPSTDTYSFRGLTAEDATNAIMEMHLYDAVNGRYLTYAGDGSRIVTASYDMEAGETIYLQVQGYYSNYGVEGTLKVTGTPVLALDEAMVIEGSADMNVSEIMKFTAPSAGLYAIETTGDTVLNNSYIYVYDENNNLISYDYNGYGKSKAICDLEAGETVRVEVIGYWTGTEESYAVIVSEYAPIAVTENADVSFVKGAGEFEWYEFTAPMTDTYTFTATRTEDVWSELYVRLYDSIGGTNLQSNNNEQGSVGVSYDLEEGDTVFVCVEWRYKQAAVDATFKVAGIPVLTMDEPMVIEGEAGVSTGAWMKFTAPSAGIYAFEPTDSTILSYNSIYLYDSNGSYVTYYDNYNGKAKVICDLAEGETVRIQIDARWSGDATYYEVEAKEYSMGTLTANEDSTVTIGPGECEWFAFTAPDTATYLFKGVEAEADYLAIYLYEDFESTYVKDNTGYEVSGVTETYDMEEGDTIYVQARGYSSETLEVTMSVSEVPSLVLDEVMTFDGIADVENSEVVKFTAETAGYYCFETTGDTVLSASSVVVSDRPYGYSTWSDENDYGKSKVVCYMEVGETVDVKVTAYWEGEESTYAIKVSAYTPTTLTEDVGTQVTLGTGEYDWYVFTAPETDTYSFKGLRTEGATDTSMSIQLYSKIGNYSSLPSNGNFSDSVSLSYDLDADETVYVKVEGYDSDDAVDATIKVSGVPELTLDANVTFDGRANVWSSDIAKFTAPEAGIYVFEPTTDTVLSQSSITVNNESNSTIKRDTNYAGRCKVICELTEGQTVRLNTTAIWTGEEDSYSVQVSEYTIPEMEENTEYALEKAAYEYELYSFTAPETNTYVFSGKTAEDATDVAAAIYLYETVNSTSYLRSNSMYSGTTALEYDLEEGQTVYVKLSAYSGYAMDAVFEVYGIPTLTLDTEHSILGTPNESVTAWMKFVVPESGTYVFEPTAETTLDSNNLYLYTREGNYWNYITESYNYYGRAKLIREFEAGTTVYLKSTATWSGEEVSYSVMVSEFAPQALSVGNDVEVVAGAGEYEWYTFTAPEKNSYTFKLTNAEDAVDTATQKIYVYDEIDGTVLASNHSSYSDVECSCEISSGTTVYIKVSGNSTYDTLDAVLNISKCTIVESGTDIVADMPANAENWYMFTAAEEGFYSFTTHRTSKEDTESGCRIYIYDQRGGSSIDSDQDYDGVTEASCLMPAGHSVYILVEPYYYDTAANVTLNIEKCTVNSLSEDNVESTISADEILYYSYPITEDGVYAISNMQNENGDTNVATVYAYTTNDPNSYFCYSSNGSENEYILLAGETIYFKVETYTDSTFVLNVEQTEVAALSAESDVVVSSEEGTKWISVTVVEDGNYEFTTEQVAGETDNYNYMYLYKFDESQGKYVQYVSRNLTPSNSLSYEIVLMEGEKVFWKVTNNNESDLVFGVDVEAFETLVIGQAYYVNVEAGEGTYFKYVAPETGNYSFYSSLDDIENHYDMYGYLYDAELKQLASNDDGNGNGQFRINYKLKAGQTVYLFVRGYDNRAGQTYAYVEKVE